MKSKIVLSFLVLMGFYAQAQMEIDKMEHFLLNRNDSLGLRPSKVLVNLSGDFYYNSNALTNSFVRSLAYRGDFIDESMKDRESKRLKKSNRTGADASAYVHAVYRTKKLDYVAGIGHREFAGARYSSDFFELVFRGNSSYAGKQADLSRTNINYFDYQSLYIGVQKQFADGRYTVGASIAGIRGGNHVALQMKDATMYTEEYGQYVDLNGDISFSRFPRDTTGASFFKSRGKGAAINLFFSMKKDKNVLNIEVRDIGFITWKGMKNYSGDSTFRYNGVLIDDLLGQGSSIVNTITMDSIAYATGMKIEQKNMTMMLPTIFHVNYMMSPNKRMTRTIGLRYMLAPGYIPEVYIRAADFLGKGFTLVNTVSYGGFGRFDYEIGAMKKFGNSFVVSLNLFAFEYLVLPGKSSGHGLNFGLTKLF